MIYVTQLRIEHVRMHRYQRSTNATENRQAVSTPLKLFRSNTLFQNKFMFSFLRQLTT